MTVDEDSGKYSTMPGLIAGLRRGEDAARMVVLRARRAMQTTDGDNTRPGSLGSTRQLPISQLFAGIRPKCEKAPMSHTERMNRIADILEEAGKRQG